MSARPPFTLPPLARDAHKGTAGRLLAIAGSAEMSGAAILVARAAQRAGAGRVTLGALDRELLSIVPLASPETVMLSLEDPRAAAGADVPGVPTSPQFHARVLGPGLGATERTLAVVRASVEGGFAGPQVFDADALNVVAGEPRLLARAAGPVVVTPHGGEASALLGGARVPSDADGRLDAARRIAETTGGLCVLKGPGSVVTDGERAFVNSTGNPGMATAGAGDVLSGILGAYLAAQRASGGEDVFAAVCAAVWVHGVAGDVAESLFGARGLVASDLVTALPEAQLRLDA